MYSEDLVRLVQLSPDVPEGFILEVPETGSLFSFGFRFAFSPCDQVRHQRLTSPDNHPKQKNHGKKDAEL